MSPACPVRHTPRSAAMRRDRTAANRDCTAPTAASSLPRSPGLVEPAFLGEPPDGGVHGAVGGLAEAVIPVQHLEDALGCGAVRDHRPEDGLLCEQDVLGAAGRGNLGEWVV